MVQRDPVVITGAVEGSLDEAVLVRLVRHVGGVPGSIYGKSGKQRLLRQVRGFNNAARFAPWVVIVDLDDDADCAPNFIREFLPNAAPDMCFRIAVRQIESWLLADRGHLANHLSVARSQVPWHPDRVQNPKLTMINLARRSRRRAVRIDMVPRPESGRLEGPAYTSRMIEFVVDGPVSWRPDSAAKTAESLARCLSCLRILVKNAI